ncbi:MAG: protein kinase domain-containing protein, partial [Marmoricola sp.]
MTATHQPPRIGGYRVLGPLGEGGMGVVHLAEDPAGRRVALKVLRPHVVGDEQARRRFAQEVSSLSRVTSDRVAGILDADPWGPEPYVVTRLVEGPSLTEHVRARGPLPEPALRRFAA